VQSRGVASNSMRRLFLPIENAFRQSGRRSGTPATGESKMGKGNNSQKNDKKSMKPKQDKKKPAVKK
jgi:hypothetical protein